MIVTKYIVSITGVPHSHLYPPSHGPQPHRGGEQ